MSTTVISIQHERMNQTNVAFGLAEGDRPAIGQRLTFNLADGVAYTGIVEDVRPRGPLHSIRFAGTLLPAE